MLENLCYITNAGVTNLSTGIILYIQHGITQIIERKLGPLTNMMRVRTVFPERRSRLVGCVVQWKERLSPEPQVLGSIPDGFYDQL